MTTPIQFLTANEWGMRWARPPVPQRMPVNVLYVHHTAGNPMRNLSAAEAFRRTNEQSINSMGLSATHYSMLVHEAANGTVTVGEARGEWTPAATRDRNTVSKAVCALGFFHPGHSLSARPSRALLDGIAWALHYCVRRGWNLPHSTVLGHRDSPPHPGRTACPGDFLHADMAAIRARFNILVANGVPAPPAAGYHIVAGGDSWWSIARAHGVTLDDLIAANPPSTAATVIRPGQRLNLPGTAPAGRYTVVPGDSWWSIAQRHGISVAELVALNPPATAATVIHPGQVLNVPGGASPTPTPPPGTPNLRRGTVHNNVPWLQAVLSSMPRLPADGGGPIFNPDWIGVDRIGADTQQNRLFGDATHNALTYWQRHNGLAADGIYGPQTANRMHTVRGR